MRVPALSRCQAAVGISCQRLRITARNLTEPVNKLTAAGFFKRFTTLLSDNPPPQVDYPMIHRIEPVGIQIGQVFDLDTAPPAIWGRSKPAWGITKLTVGGA
jgi:hypothetical protein